MCKAQKYYIQWWWNPILFYPAWHHSAYDLVTTFALQEAGSVGWGIVMDQGCVVWRQWLDPALEGSDYLTVVVGEPVVETAHYYCQCMRVWECLTWLRGRLLGIGAWQILRYCIASPPGCYSVIPSLATWEYNCEYVSTRHRSKYLQTSWLI